MIFLIAHSQFVKNLHFRLLLQVSLPEYVLVFLQHLHLLQLKFFSVPNPTHSKDLRIKKFQLISTSGKKYYDMNWFR